MKEEFGSDNLTFSLALLEAPGHEINFFFWFPKFFKVVANSKKLVAIFKEKKTFFNAVSFLDKPSKINVLQSGH